MLDGRPRSVRMASTVRAPSTVSVSVLLIREYDAPSAMYAFGARRR